MSDERIIAGEQSEGSDSGRILAGESNSPGLAEPAAKEATLKDRVAASTRAGGLKQLPAGFDDPQGDWITINSSNPFELLYLDYRQYRFINPEMVLGNHSLLEKFWKEKLGTMMTGGNRVAFKNKYGEGTIENSLPKLKRALEKLKSPNGIEHYYAEINNARLRAGEEKLKDSIEHMMMDGSADRSEIRLCLERGLKYDLQEEETAKIVKHALDEANFSAYGQVTGETLAERLLSVDHWMTEAKTAEAERLRKERESLRIQILPGKYASGIEQIGNILFEDPREAKEIIREDLLKSVIAQKDVVLARVIAAISKDTKDLDAAYLRVIYTLNPLLPYRFAENQVAKTVEELCAMIFESPQTFKTGKEHLTKGYIEIWLKESNLHAYNILIRIRDTAASAHLALLQFIYTFCPALPYRFAGRYLVHNPSGLLAEITMNGENWEAAKTELMDGSIPVWLRTTGNAGLIQPWEVIKEKYEGRFDAALEEFLHLLDDKLPYGTLTVDRPALAFPAIESRRIVSAELIFSNETRGYVEGSFSWSKPIDGVSLSSEKLVINKVAGVSRYKLLVSISTALLVNGLAYETSIVLQTLSGQRIEIPVSFRVVFPKKGFFLEIARYAGMVSVFFVLTRLLLSQRYPDWLAFDFDFFLTWDMAFRHPEQFAVFGLTFFLFLLISAAGLFLLTRYFRKHEKG
ncbi:MAG TPA: hypothetical protein VEZ17_07040 [Chitinophagaceae bacterium]|nr:hypothetical protein [Chitinophagaceae bacterium]